MIHSKPSNHSGLNFNSSFILAYIVQYLWPYILHQAHYFCPSAQKFMPLRPSTPRFHRIQANQGPHAGREQKFMQNLVNYLLLRGVTVRHAWFREMNTLLHAHLELSLQ